MPVRSVVLLLAALAVAACDSSTPEVSSFEASITGDVVRQLSGPAGLQDCSGADDPTFCIEMVPGGFGVEGLRLRSEGLAITERGTYALGATRGGMISLAYSSPDGQFVAESGTVEVTRFSDAYVAGTFTADLRSETGDASLTVQGRFDALPPDLSILY